MRIKHKYLRNRLVKSKARNKAKRLHGEFSLKAYMPYSIYGSWYRSYENQLKDRQEYLDDLAIINSSGGHRFHAPKHFKRPFERSQRRKVKITIHQICNGDEELEIPIFKYNADWEWF
jgi:hypothetical protein